MEIRQATPDDIPAMVELSRQLGYAVSANQMAERLAAYFGRADHIVMLAASDGRVQGFVNGGLRRDLVSEDSVELMSLVVAEDARGRGVGKALLQAFERWVSTLGLDLVTLGSRDTRKDAHRFYEREGYELVKLHHIYRKRL